MELTKQEKLDCKVIVECLLDHFDLDSKKCWNWFETENPQLGGISPWEMIKTGRIEKLREFVETSIQENERE